MDMLKRLQATRYLPIEQQVTPRDAMLYALGIGFGESPLDPDQLKFVYEKDLQVFPTMAITLCYPSMGAQSTPDSGLDMRRTLHVFQSFELSAPIPLDRTLVGQTRITGVFDKGAGRGILWTYQNLVHDRDSRELVCVLNGASMSLVGGGGGGPRGESRPKREFPSRAPDAVCETKTLQQAALIYRLSGDYNPFHVDPEMARQGGFDCPILHGRCTFGVAGRAIVQAFCDGDGQSLPKMEARFSSPVFPGETIRTEMWREQQDVLFRSHVPERDVTVLDQGYAELKPRRVSAQ
jgi:acyl dehydratase